MSAENGAPEKRPPLERLYRNRPVLRAIGYGFAGYLAFVRATSRVVFEPEDPYAAYAPHLPAIVTMWHGQHFMLPFLRRDGHDVRAMISRSDDGEINAAVVEALGLGTVRASAARVPWHIREKRGVPGFLAMRRALDEGATVCMTADLPKQTARRVGLGIVKLAQASGRPILAVSFLTRNRLTIPSWDRSELNLPFGRAACVVGPPIYVEARADDVALETARSAVEAMLATVTHRAAELTGRHDA